MKDECKWKVTDACILFTVGKLDKDADFWPRLTKDSGKLAWLKWDWDKWVDESDEEPEDQEFDYGNMMNFEEMDEEEEEEEAPDSDEEENFQKARLSAQGRFGAGGDLRVPMEGVS